MTPRIPAVASKEVARALIQIGFVLDRQSGSHAVYYRETDKRRVVIPVHSGKTIKPKTLASIVNDMGLSMDEFRELI